MQTSWHQQSSDIFNQVSCGRNSEGFFSRYSLCTWSCMLRVSVRSCLCCHVQKWLLWSWLDSSLYAHDQLYSNRDRHGCGKPLSPISFPSQIGSLFVFVWMLEKVNMYSLFCSSNTPDKTFICFTVETGNLLSFRFRFAAVGTVVILFSQLWQRSPLASTNLL